MDWVGMLVSAKEKDRIYKKRIKDEQWYKKYITPESVKILNECSHGFDKYNSVYGSEAVLVNHILRLEKRIEDLEKNAKNDKQLTNLTK